MENAATGCVDVILQNRPNGVLLCCGIGNNGGDGFAMTRILRSKGIFATAVMCGPKERVTGDALINLNRLEAETTADDLSVYSPEKMDELLNRDDVDWIVDALLGTGSSGDPRPPYDDVIRKINRADRTVLAVDIPSGLHCDSGVPGTPTVYAQSTCTFVTQKTGFQNQLARPHLGTIHVIDIGVPQSIVDAIARGQE